MIDKFYLTQNIPSNIILLRNSECFECDMKYETSLKIISESDSGKNF